MSNMHFPADNEDLPAYYPMEWTLAEIRAAIPPRLFVRRTYLGLLYVARDIAVATLLWYCATFIDVSTSHPRLRSALGPAGVEITRWLAWLLYWWFQGLTFTGIWIIGHECGHYNISHSRSLCDTIGYLLHTAVLTPYFSWKYSHHRHHIHHASMEKDALWLPDTRSEIGLHRKSPDYKEYINNTPLYTVSSFLLRQLFGYPAYLLTNVKGPRHSPRWTNHFNPNAVLFSVHQRNDIILSDFGIFITVCLIVYASRTFGIAQVLKFYGIPWFCLSHWLAMITFLQHTDPQIPRFRANAWTFVRGAAATVDRKFLGWQGRFFLHNAARFHTVHHFFPMIPFYHGEEATMYLKAFLGEHYMYSDKAVFKALWDNFNACQFVETDGDIVFPKDRRGKAARRVAPRPRGTT